MTGMPRTTLVQFHPLCYVYTTFENSSAVCLKYYCQVDKMALLRSVALWGFVIFCQNTNSAIGANFSYRGNNNDITPDRWGGQCQTGKRQSPIDIPVSSSDFANAPTRNLVLSDRYFDRQVFNAKNNGLNLEVEIQDRQKSTCTVNGNLVNNEEYKLAQLNFRWGLPGILDGSEHSVNGSKYAMELHMVHYKSIYRDVYQAAQSNDSNALSILTVFFEICVVDNSALRAIIRIFPNIMKAESEGEGFGLILAKFLQINYKQNVPLMQYNGSTTIPDCYETAVWYVFKDPQCMSLRQLNAFRSLSGEDGKPLGDNDRPLQDRKNRKIYYIETAIQPQGGRRPGIFRPFTVIADWLRLL